MCRIKLTVVIAAAAIVLSGPATAQNDMPASNAKIKSACKQEVEAANPSGTLSNKCQPSNTLTKDCIVRAKGRAA